MTLLASPVTPTCPNPPCLILSVAVMSSKLAIPGVDSPSCAAFTLALPIAAHLLAVGAPVRAARLSGCITRFPEDSYLMEVKVAYSIWGFR